MRLKFGSFFIKIIFFVIGFFIFSPLSARAMGMGVSPSQIDLGSVHADNVITQSLTVMLDNEGYQGVSRIKVDLEGVGKEAVQFESDAVIFKDGETKKDWHYTINPKNLLPGKYQIKMLFFPVSTSEFGGDNDLKVKISAVVNFEVTTKSVLNIDAFIGTAVIYGSPGDSVKFDLYLKNLGNTKELIDRVKIKIESKFDQTNREFFYVPSSTVSLDPKNTIFFPTIFTIPTDLSLGVYKANFSYYSQGRLIKEHKGVDLRVEASRLIKKSFKLYYVVVGFLSFIFLILLIKFFKK